MEPNSYKITEAGWEVPAFEEISFNPKRSRYCVCIPVLNEGARIQNQLARMKEISGDHDIIIADGGSTDQSVAPDVIKKFGVRALLIKTGPGYLSAQMRMAMAYALQEGYSGIIFIDGNDKDDPAAIPLFAHELDNGYDHIQGSRFIEGGRSMNTPWYRYLAIRLIHAPLISAAAHFRYTDTTNGFRAYSARFLRDARVQPFRKTFSGYELHYYLAIRAAQLGLKVKEIPVTRTYPKSGDVPSKIASPYAYVKIMVTLFRSCIGRFNPKQIISRKA